MILPCHASLPFFLSSTSPSSRWIGISGRIGFQIAGRLKAERYEYARGSSSRYMTGTRWIESSPEKGEMKRKKKKRHSPSTGERCGGTSSRRPILAAMMVNIALEFENASCDCVLWEPDMRERAAAVVVMAINLW